MKEQTGGKRLTKAAQEYIEKHSREKFSLDQIAGALYINGSYLARTFKQSTGMTLLHYHHLVRCGEARDLLLHTDKSVSEIGSITGFATSSHFSHIFRKMMGCTPSEYRRLWLTNTGEKKPERKA